MNDGNSPHGRSPQQSPQPVDRRNDIDDPTTVVNQISDDPKPKRNPWNPLSRPRGNGTHGNPSAPTPDALYPNTGPGSFPQPPADRSDDPMAPLKQTPESQRVDEERSAPGAIGRKNPVVQTSIIKNKTGSKKFKKSHVNESSDQDLLEASVQISYIHPARVAKISGAIGIAIALVWVFTIAILYIALDFMHVWEKLNASMSSGNEETTNALISPWWVLWTTLGSGFIIAICVTVFGFFGAVIYNLCAEAFGGITVELQDDPF